MSATATIVGVILPPVTFVVFVAAMLSRLWTWKKLPQPGMTLFPTSPKGTTAGVLKETLLFPSLFKSDRFLWAISWLFHAMLALIIIGHLRVVTDFPWLWSALNIDADTMSAVVGGAAGVMILIFRPFDLGDKVTAAGNTGKVNDIGLFATTLVTADNETIITPNSTITSDSIINHTTRGTLRGNISVGVAYGSNIDQAAVRAVVSGVNAILSREDGN